MPTLSAGAPTFIGYRPGIIADIVGLHARYYAKNWSFGAQFEALVAEELGHFVAVHDPNEDLFLSAVDGDTHLGSIVIDRTVSGRPDAAKLRWFIVSDAARGTGLGRALLGRAVAFSDERGTARITLSTFAGLDAARHLYEAYGFVLVHEAGSDRWHGGVGQQTFERLAPRREGS